MRTKLTVAAALAGTLLHHMSCIGADTGSFCSGPEK